MKAFKYLGRAMTEGYDDWSPVTGNLQKSRKSCGANIENFETGGGGSEGVGSLLQDGSPGGVAVWAEIWVLTPRMEQSLISFQNRVARWLTGRKLRSRGDGSWHYHPLEVTM